jgi:cation diffusion facilitator family transporter
MTDKSRYRSIPDDLKGVMQNAIILGRLTFFYLLSVILIMYLVVGNSQAMKSAWMEDMISIIPSIAFLIASQFFFRKPNRTFPYGYHRAFNIAAFIAALALALLGVYLIIDSVMSLSRGHRPTIGLISILGFDIWMGWVMIAALLYSSIPAMLIGKKKEPLARKLHNKVLFIDAKMQEADYTTALAAIAGILLVGFGFWWADAISAIIISLSVIKDGAVNLYISIKDIVDNRPETIDSHQEDPKIEQIRKYIRSLSWVKEGKLRLREHGQVYYGEIFIIPNTGNEELIERMESLRKEINAMNWKFFDIYITAGYQYTDEWDQL